MKALRLPLFFLLLAAAVQVQAQFSPNYQWTLLNQSVMDEIIGEASGETAYNHILEMGAYNRNRPLSEYQTMLWEAEYVLSKLHEYGFQDAKVERFESGRQTWDGIRAELWEIEPGRKKLADYDDLRAMLASGSQNADVEAELVWVEEGQEDDFDGLDVTGKIVLTSGSPGGVHRLAVSRGAVGLISFYSPRPLVDPIQIPWSGISGRGGSDQQATFGFFLPPREGHLLRDRLIRGEKIKVHASVEAEMVDLDLQVPTCVIQGTQPDAEEVIFSAHLFEGYTKQGANDNISGSAAILEVARMLKTMIDEGRIERPARSIRFIWIPEFSGSIPWVNAHLDIMAKTLCNINLDMVGLWLSKSQSFFNLERTTYANPHYVNDVMENYFRYVGETNRVSLPLSGREGYLNRIVAPSGSDEPFYYAVEHHYGASDHEVFNDWGIGVPGVMLITWPDLYYHTSQDRADKCDPTQLKRVCVISAAGAYTIAAADREMARRIADETFANATRRMGQQAARAFDELGKADAKDFANTWTRTRGYIQAVGLNEKATLQTVAELAPNDPVLTNYLNQKIDLITQITQQETSSLDQLMTYKASQPGYNKPETKPGKLEVKAAKIYPKETSLVKAGGYGAYRSAMSDLSREESMVFMGGIGNTTELQRLCTGQYNLLEIKQLLDTQFKRESDLQIILDYVEMLKNAGLVTW